MTTINPLFLLLFIFGHEKKIVMTVKGFSSAVILSFQSKLKLNIQKHLEWKQVDLLSFDLKFYYLLLPLKIVVHY